MLKIPKLELIKVFFLTLFISNYRLMITNPDVDCFFYFIDNLTVQKIKGTQQINVSNL